MSQLLCKLNFHFCATTVTANVTTSQTSFLKFSPQFCHVRRFFVSSAPTFFQRRSLSEFAPLQLLREINELPAKTLSILMLPASVLLGFGLWSGEHGKAELKRLYASTERDPQLLPRDISRYHADGDVEYMPVKIRGKFDHNREVVITPRQKLPDREKVQDSSVRNVVSTSDKSNAGGLVITPFKLEDRPWTILVNRGWVPMHRLDPSTRKEGQVEGIVELNGFVVVRDDPKGLLSMFSKGNDPDKNVWRRIDLFELALNGHALNIMVAADAKSTLKEGPIGGQGSVRLRDEISPLSVVINSVCILTTVGWYAIFVRKYRPLQALKKLFD